MPALQQVIVDTNNRGKLKDINHIQETIMKYVDHWVRTEKTPIPQKEIINKMQSNGNSSHTVVHALSVLLKKGYIRRAYMSATNKTYYVQIRGI